MSRPRSVTKLRIQELTSEELAELLNAAPKCQARRLNNHTLKVPAAPAPTPRIARSYFVNPLGEEKLPSQDPISESKKEEKPKVRLALNGHNLFKHSPLDRAGAKKTLTPMIPLLKMNRV